MAKNLVAFRLSAQAIEHLESISEITGSSKTAIIELALAKLYQSMRENKMSKYTVQHLGHPVTNLSEVLDSNWKTYSTHATFSAACKSVIKAKSHLETGTWDDHYRIIDPDGKLANHQDFERFCDGNL